MRRLGCVPGGWWRVLTPIDFSLQRRKPGRRGLTMRLTVGPVSSHKVETEFVDVDEAAFGFLEPAVSDCWPLYSNYAHWGVTPIPREAWVQVISLWMDLRNRAAASEAVEQLPKLRFVTRWAREAVDADFSIVKTKLPRFIDELSAWIMERLLTTETITIEGV